MLTESSESYCYCTGFSNSKSELIQGWYSTKGDENLNHILLKVSHSKCLC
jgi:hypothetical protein